MSESVSGVDAILAGLRHDLFMACYEPNTLAVQNAQQIAEAAVHATVREIEAWLRSDPVEVYRVRLADEVARRFGGTDA